jgi:TatD DNase family protein
VAIGEIGLDYYHPDSDRAAQQEWFIRQINLATEFSLPIIIHSRDAAADTLSILKTNSGNQPRLVHCFSYSKEIAAEYLKMGDYYFGIGGVVTFKNAKKLHESVYHIPLERLLLETDSPYLTPHPYRGKRNSSLYLGYIVSAIAQIKAIAPELVIEQTTKNAKEFYGIS